MLNGSPHPKGETYKALCIVEDALKTEGVDTKWLWIGNKPIRGCIDCNKCAKTGRCIFNDDPCNDIIDAILECDGVLIGTPVYFQILTAHYVLYSTAYFMPVKPTPIHSAVR